MKENIFRGGYSLIKLSKVAIQLTISDDMSKASFDKTNWCPTDLREPLLWRMVRCFLFKCCLDMRKMNFPPHFK